MPYTRLSKMPLAWKNLMEARKGRVDHNAAAFPAKIAIGLGVKGFALTIGCQSA